jgi:hypothetical protein
MVLDRLDRQVEKVARLCSTSSIPHHSQCVLLCRDVVSQWSLSLSHEAVAHIGVYTTSSESTACARRRHKAANTRYHRPAACRLNQSLDTSKKGTLPRSTRITSHLLCGSRSANASNHTLDGCVVSLGSQLYLRAESCAPRRMHSISAARHHVVASRSHQIKTSCPEHMCKGYASEAGSVGS